MVYQPAVFVTWEELFDEQPTQEETEKFLRICNRQHTAQLLCRMATFLYLDRFHQDPDQTVRTQKHLVANFLDKEVRLRADERLRKSREPRVAFHLQQVLTFLKWTILYAMQDGGIDPGVAEETRWALGRCLLKQNDFFLTKEMQSEIDEDRRLPSAKNFMRLQLLLGVGNEVNNPPVVTNAVIRTATIFESILKKLQLPIDLNAAFGNKAGLTLEEYVDFAMGAVANYMGRDPRAFVTDPARIIINPRTFLGNLASAESVERFWKMESSSLDEFHNLLTHESTTALRQDFTAFRMTPFIRLNNGQLICINPGFLQEKLEIGLFWRIVNVLDGDDRRKAFDSWGYLFEHYVGQTIESSVTEGVETYIPRPNFDKKKHHHESFDGILISGPVCILFECKGGFLPNPAKYGENLDAFVKAFDAKFGLGQGAGIEQLARKIGQVFASTPENRRKLEGIDLSQVEIIVPVLVAQDATVSSFFTIPWLAELFQEAMKKETVLENVVLTNLLVVHIEELENLCAFGHAGKLALSECFLFGGEKGAPRRGHYFVFEDILNELLQEKKVDRLPSLATDERFGEVLDRVCLRLFGRHFERLARDSKPSDT